jgi:hypothetical protein
MPDPEDRSGSLGETVAIYALAIPVVGLLMGGIYSLPAMRACRGKDRCLTVLLAGALAVTIFGLGRLAGTPVAYSAGGWVVSLVFLLAKRRMHGSLDGNVERFGVVHAFALLIVFALAMFTRNGMSSHA